MTIVGVDGSLRDGSTCSRVLEFVLAEAAAAGAAVRRRTGIGILPLLDGRDAEEYPFPVKAWRESVRSASALIVVTPSYHGAIPGGLKNALDFIERSDMAGKPFAVIGVASGDAEPAVTDVTRVLRHIGGVAAVADVVISRSRERWGAGAEPADQSLAAEVRSRARDLVALCERWPGEVR